MLAQSQFQSSLVQSRAVVASPPKRNPSVELLRCVLMFLIVLHHAAFLGYWEGDASQLPMLLGFTTLTYWHVDSFVAVSGWFGIKFNWRKFFSLWSVVAFYAVCSVGYLLLTKGRFSPFQLFSFGGWFAGTYLMLMLMSPLLNAAVEHICSKGRKAAFCAWLPFAIGMVCAWFPAHFMSFVIPGGRGAFTILTMSFVYVTARMLKTLNIQFRNSKVLLLAGGGYIIMSGISYSIFKIAALLGIGDVMNIELFTKIASYDSPHTIALSVLIVYFFAVKVKVSDCMSRIVFFIAPSIFGIYLLHDTTSFGRLLYRIPETYLSSHTMLSPMLIVFLCAILTFILSLVGDLGRRFIFFSLSELFCFLTKMRRRRRAVTTCNLRALKPELDYICDVKEL